MHRHVSKRVKMHIKPTDDTNKHDKHIIARSEKGEGYARSDLASRDASQAVTPKQGLVGVECNQTRSSPWRAPNMAKPRTRLTLKIKYRSKQA